MYTHIKFYGTDIVPSDEIRGGFYLLAWDVFLDSSWPTRPSY